MIHEGDLGTLNLVRVIKVIANMLFVKRLSVFFELTSERVFFQRVCLSVYSSVTMGGLDSVLLIKLGKELLHKSLAV